MARFDGTNEAPTLLLQVDIGSVTDFTLDVSTLDGAALLGTNTSWQTLPMTDALELSIRRGRQREDQPNDAGTLTVVFDNITGNYDPDNSGAGNPYTFAGSSWFRTGLDCKLVATWNSITYPLFRGRLEDPQCDIGEFPRAVFTFVDGMADASNDLTSFTPAVETTSQRANRALDLMGWPSDRRTISGALALLASGQTTNATSIIEECASAEAGRFYADASGNLRLTTLSDALTRTVKVTLTDADTSGTSDYLTIKTSPGVKYIVNSSTVTNGTYSAAFTNTASISTTRVRRALNRNLPLSSDSDIDTLALYLANHRATAQTRVEAVTVSALGVGSAWAGLLDTDLGDRCRVKRTALNNVTVDLELSVEGISHTISQRGWDITFNTAPIDVTGSEFTLDTSLLNGSDVLAA